MKPIYVAPRKTAGLNNLKMVLFGMAVLAKENEGHYEFPEQVFDFTPVEDGIGESYLPISSVFDIDSLSIYYNLDIEVAGSRVRLGNAEYLEAAQRVIRADAGRMDVATNPTAEAFAAFKASHQLKSCANKIVSALPPDTCAIQLRIERDWLEYAKRKGWEDGIISGDSEIVLNHRRIFQKMSLSAAIPRRAFVCCDEDDLLVSRKIIEDDAKKFGFELIFKSDFETPFKSRLQKSVVDFAVCLNLATYVGTRRSTFSNMLCMVKASEIQGHPDHYAFDTKSESVSRRKDLGRV